MSAAGDLYRVPPTGDARWPRVGMVDPLEAKSAGWPACCMAAGPNGDHCTRAPDHPLPHVAVDVDPHDPDGQRCTVTCTWLPPLTGDYALGPVDDAITMSVHVASEAEACREAVLSALGIAP